MIKEIQAKTILNSVRQPDTWFGLKYNLNLYRGCQHQCIYCDSRSLCYQIKDFDHEVLVKVNAVELLRDEIARKRVKGTIGTGSMNDPYMPVETKYGLTRRALEVIAEFRFPVHIITKSDLVLRDLDILKRINEVYAAVSFTVTTAEDELARRVEPGAPRPSARFHAMKVLASHGIHTGVTMMPILPFIEDNEENITAIVEKAHAAGAEYILAWFGMTLRDRQRLYFYKKLDKHFPGVKEQYMRAFGDKYEANAREWRKLDRLFEELIYKYKILPRMPLYSQEKAEQLSLF
jgi:DNA repair photolyase